MKSGLFLPWVRGAFLCLSHIWMVTLSWDVPVVCSFVWGGHADNNQQSQQQSWSSISCSQQTNEIPLVPVPVHHIAGGMILLLYYRLDFYSLEFVFCGGGRVVFAVTTSSLGHSISIFLLKSHCSLFYFLFCPVSYRSYTCYIYVNWNWFNYLRLEIPRKFITSIEHDSLSHIYVHEKGNDTDKMEFDRRRVGTWYGPSSWESSTLDRRRRSFSEIWLFPASHALPSHTQNVTYKNKADCAAWVLKILFLNVGTEFIFFRPHY